MKVTFELNGKPVTCPVTPKLTLLRLLRDQLKLTGAKPGCEKGDCGACSVLVDGKLEKSCLYPARKLDGKVVVTIEGLANPDGSPNDLQQAFLDYGATQCGYCTPGMVIAGEALLRQNPTPSRLQIREAIAGNLCRCTGYLQIIEAIEATAQNRQKEGDR